MTQTSFASIDVINIQMIRERQLLYNGNRLTQPEQAAEAFEVLREGVADSADKLFKRSVTNRIKSRKTKSITIIYNLKNTTMTAIPA